MNVRSQTVKEEIMDEEMDVVENIEIENVPEGWIVDVTFRDSCSGRHVFTSQSKLMEFIDDFTSEPNRVV